MKIELKVHSSHHYESYNFITSIELFSFTASSSLQERKLDIFNDDQIDSLETKKNILILDSKINESHNGEYFIEKYFIHPNTKKVEIMLTKTSDYSHFVFCLGEVMDFKQSDFVSLTINFNGNLIRNQTILKIPLTNNDVVHYGENFYEIKEVRINESGVCEIDLGGIYIR